LGRFLSRGNSLNPSRWEKACPSRLAPWVSVYWRSIVALVRCRSRPSIIAATSLAEQVLSWE
jgi:hypothetical protein